MTFSYQNSSNSPLLHCKYVCLSVCLCACMHFYLCAIHVHLSMLCVCACVFLSVMCYVLCGGILSSWLSGGALVVSHPDPSLLFCHHFWSEDACQKWWWNRGDAFGCETSALVRRCSYKFHCIASEYAISMSLTCPYFSLQRGTSPYPTSAN